MAETAITGALSKLAEFGAREAKLLLQVGGDIVLLRDRLEWLLAFVADADRKHRAGTDGLTRVWVRQTRDVAFATEDALDYFLHKGPRWKICYTDCMLTSKIKKIKSRLKQISENQQAYKIEHTPLVTLTSSNITSLAWSDDFQNTVDFDAELEPLENMLLEDNTGPLKFISLVGEGGIGKSTLASAIFRKREANFEIRLWYDMQLDSNKEVLLKGIYNQAKKKNQAVSRTELENPSINPQEKKKENPSIRDDTGDVAAKLASLLSGKRYLLILGGIRSETILNWLKPRLPDGNSGSKVVLLLDTASEAVARQAENLNGDGKTRTHLLSRLDEERSKALFRSRVVTVRREPPPDVMEKMSTYCKTVYSITKGYPLAIVLLSGLLRFKEKPTEWEAVLQQINPVPDSGSNHITGDVVSGDRTVLYQLHGKLNPATEVNLNTRTEIDRIFWASFDDLPSDLKSCYLYFAVFAKNTVQYADQIVRMWIAEGFIKPRVGKTMEEQGDDYLKELVSRFLLKIQWLNDSGGILAVRVHLRVHEFLESEVREAGFVDIHSPHHVFVPPSARRLSFQSYDGRYTMVSNDLPKLRSFVCRVLGADKSRGNTDVNKCHCGLNLAACFSCGEEDDHHGEGNDRRNQVDEENPKKDLHDIKFLHGPVCCCIVKMKCRSKFLRVISIMGLNLVELPEEIGGLIQLRYLLVDSNDLKNLPSSIKGLLNLQTLDIRNTKVKKIDKGFWKISGLRHILAEDLTLPAKIEKELNELQTLNGVKPAQGQKWNAEKFPLKKMTNLRSVELHGFVGVTHGAALENSLTNMHLLSHLKVKGTEIPSCILTGQGLRPNLAPILTDSLQYLRTVVLKGQVVWQAAAEFENIRTLRPNLFHLKLKSGYDASEDIQNKLAVKGFQRTGDVKAPVYKLSYTVTGGADQLMQEASVQAPLPTGNTRNLRINDGSSSSGGA